MFNIELLLKRLRPTIQKHEEYKGKKSSDQGNWGEPAPFESAGYWIFKHGQFGAAVAERRESKIMGRVLLAFIRYQSSSPCRNSMSTAGDYIWKCSLSDCAATRDLLGGSMTCIWRLVMSLTGRVFERLCTAPFCIPICFLNHSFSPITSNLDISSLVLASSSRPYFPSARRKSPFPETGLVSTWWKSRYLKPVRKPTWWNKYVAGVLHVLTFSMIEKCFVRFFCTIKD